MPNARTDYAARTVSLKTLGFSSYAEFLRSDLWSDIKREYFKRKGTDVCCCCGSQERLQVHHVRYTAMSRAKYLKTVCGDCHKLIHEHSSRTDLRHTLRRSTKVIRRKIT